MVATGVISKARSDYSEFRTVKPQVKRSSAVSQILKKLHENDLTENISLETFSFSAAHSNQDRRGCFELAYNEYYKKGYVNASNDERMISSKFDIAKSTLVVMAKNNSGEIVGTLTIIIDEAMGLPSDELFRDELITLRNDCSGVAEVVRLAIKNEYKCCREILVGMFRLVFNYVKNIAKCRYLIIEVNPRHVRYYERLLWFKVISKEKVCMRVEGAPALLLCLDRDLVLHKKATVDSATLAKSLYEHFTFE